MDWNEVLSASRTGWEMGDGLGTGGERELVESYTGCSYRLYDYLGVIMYF